MSLRSMRTAPKDGTEIASMVLTYRYRLQPTKAQHAALERILEDQRQLYNAALEERIAYYDKTGQLRTLNGQSRALAECRRLLPHMAAVPHRLQMCTLKWLDRAFAQFFRRSKAGDKRAGFPRFKAKHHFNSFGFSQFAGIRFDGKRLRFKGMPGGLRVRLHREMPTTPILCCQFQCDAKGWSICMQVCEPIKEPTAASAPIGIDLGINTLAALSDGTLVPNPRVALRAKRKTRVRQRALARCKRGSARRRKACKRLALLHYRTANARRTYLHQVTARLVRRHDLIAIEALNISKLAKSRIACSVHDAGWGKFVAMLRYKATRTGVQMIEVSPAGTSQECPDCGAVARKALGERVHSCACGCTMDRDVAAAQIILNRAVVGPGSGNVAHLRGERRIGNLATCKPLPCSDSSEKNLRRAQPRKIPSCQLPAPEL